MAQYIYREPDAEYAAMVRSADMEKLPCAEPLKAGELVAKIYTDAEYESTLKGKRLVVTGIFTVADTAPGGASSIVVSDKDGGTGYVLCLLQNDKQKSDLAAGDTVIVDGNFYAMDEHYNLVLERARIETVRKKMFENWTASKMPTREKMDRVLVETFPMYEDGKVYDCKALFEKVVNVPGTDAELDYARPVIRGIASRFTSPYKAPAIEFSTEVGGQCYAIAVWDPDSDIYDHVHIGDTVTVHGNYLWTHPALGVVIKSPVVVEDIPAEA